MTVYFPDQITASLNKLPQDFDLETIKSNCTWKGAISKEHYGLWCVCNSISH